MRARTAEKIGWFGRTGELVSAALLIPLSELALADTPIRTSIIALADNALLIPLSEREIIPLSAVRR